MVVVAAVLGLGYYVVQTKDIQSSLNVQGSYADNKSSTIKIHDKPVAYSLHVHCSVVSGVYACK